MYTILIIPNDNVDLWRNKSFPLKSPMSEDLKEAIMKVSKALANMETKLPAGWAFEIKDIG